MKRILICGAGGTPATNFVRSLRMMNDKVFLVGVDCDKFTLHRAETDIKLLVPKADDSCYIDIINKIIEEYDLEFIHLQNDKEIEVISENREKIKAKVFLPSKETIRICLDKFSSYESWEKAGIKVPKTVMINNQQDLTVAFEKYGPKLWLRDIKGAAGNGSFPTDDFEEAVNWINFKKGWGHFTAAECLTDDSVTWMSIWFEGRLIVAQGRRRLYWELANRAPSGITGITGTGVTYSDPKFDNLAVRVVKAIDSAPHGIYSVDMTYDRQGMPNPTEINIGRFFTTHLFFTKAGLNMPEIFVKLAYGEKFKEPSKVFNPLPDGLAWVRGMDFEPILLDMSIIEKTEMEFKERLNKICQK